jgi:predicted nucleotidyltransferase
MVLDERTMTVIRDCLVPLMASLHIIVFDSYARGDADENSDIDVAVIVPNGAGTTLRTVASCNIALHDAFDKNNIDLSIDFLVYRERSYNKKR